MPSQIKAKDFTNPTFQSTSALLTQNPEYYTIWNFRRVILQNYISAELSKDPSSLPPSDLQAAEAANHTPAQHEILLLLREDLAFLIPLLKQYPKCYWIWNHRAWLLATATEHLPCRPAIELWKGELGLVTKMLGLDPRNFHGWGYRRDVVAHLERLGGESMVETEFEYATKMIQGNLSNFSAWHYRSQLIPPLLSARRASAGERRQFLAAEFDLITKALYTDPYDQSLWFYHQYLMATLDPANAQAVPILDPCGRAERLRYLEQEIQSLREMLDGAEDCKYIYQALLDYARRYRDLGAGTAAVTMQEMRGWLSELRKIDPLREGRWRDLEAKMES